MTKKQDHPTSKSGPLVRKYGAPPFSILDAKQGYWQDRKRAWLEVGVDDSDSRRGLKTTGSLSGTDPRYYQEKMQVERSLGHTISNAEFEAKHYVPHQNSRLRSSTGGGIVSIFDPVLCELIYRWFCPKRGNVLDPFAGGPVRGIVAAALGRRYTGVDLSKDQLSINRKQWGKLPDRLRRNWTRPTWRRGDSRDVVKLTPGRYDLVFTCPPYGNLERYSDDPSDLSAMPHEDFLLAYRQVIAASTAMLKQDRFACVVISDIRCPKGFCRNLVSDTIDAFRGAGLRLYNDAILATMIGSLPMRVGRMFDASRKLGRTHQNVLVFVKGDPTVATRAVGPVEMPDDPLILCEIGKRQPRSSVKAKLCSPIHYTRCRRAVA